jgi:hypothetical protein
VAGVRTKADHVRTELGLEDSADVGVVQRAKALGLQDLADDPAVFDGQAEPVSVEVRAHRGLGHSAGDGHRGDHRPVEAKFHLGSRELSGPLDLVSNVDRLVER